MAHLVHRLGRRGGGAERQGRGLRRWPLYAAGAEANRHLVVRAARSGGGRPARLASRQPAAGRQAGLRPLAARPPMAWRPCAMPRKKRAAALVACAIQSASTRCGPTARTRPRAKPCRMPFNLSGEDSKAKRARIAEVVEESESRRGGDHPVRFRSAGCSISVAATFPIRRSRWPSPSCMPTAAPNCSWTKKSAAPDWCSIWAMACASEAGKRIHRRAGRRSKANMCWRIPPPPSRPSSTGWITRAPS